MKVLPTFWASRLLSQPKNRILKGCKYFAKISFGVHDYISAYWSFWKMSEHIATEQGRDWEKHAHWKQGKLARPHFSFPRDQLAGFCLLRGMEEVSLWKPLEGVRGFLPSLIASQWSLSSALSPRMTPASLLWRLEQPLCRARPIPNTVAQMPSLNSSLVWCCHLSACLRKPGWEAKLINLELIFTWVHLSMSISTGPEQCSHMAWCYDSLWSRTAHGVRWVPLAVRDTALGGPQSQH